MLDVGHRLPREAGERAQVDIVQDVAKPADGEIGVNIRSEVAGAGHVIDQERTMPVLGERPDRLLDREDVDDLPPQKPEDVPADHERIGQLGWCPWPRQRLTCVRHKFAEFLQCAGTDVMFDALGVRRGRLGIDPDGQQELVDRFVSFA